MQEAGQDGLSDAEQIAGRARLITTDARPVSHAKARL